MMLGQAIGCDHNRIVFVIWRHETVMWFALEVLCGRVTLLLIEGIMDGRLCRFIVGWQRPIFEPFGYKKPAFAIRFHNERVSTRVSIHSSCTRRWRVVGWPGDREIRHIVTSPFALLLVPPDVFLPLGPRATLWICRSAIVENTPVEGPCKSPLREGIAPRDA